MTGTYPGGLQLSATTDLGTVSANSTGPILTTSGTSYVKGSWAQVVASLSQDASWVMFYIETLHSSGTNYSVDIGIGAGGSEIAIVSNLYACGNNSVATRLMFPLCIPAGTRVAARTAGNGSSNSPLSIGLTVFSDSYHSAGCGSSIDTYGFNSSTILGTSVDAGTTINTKGAYAQITSSTSADIAGIFLIFDQQNNAAGTAGSVYHLIDIAVGAAASEVVIVPNIPLSSFQSGGNDVMMEGFVPYMPVQIPAGSRISARCQSSTNVSPDRIIGCTIYGVRL